MRIAILVAHNDPIESSLYLQESLSYIQRWLKKWRIKTNRTKSVHVMFTTCKEICPLVILNGLRIRQAEDAKYLELHLDRRLNWKKHMLTKQKQLGFQLGKMYWLLSSKLQFSRK
jgi:hypothetical protein